LGRQAAHNGARRVPDAFFKSLYANPPETGSDQPRALLAYYYAFAHTVREFSSALTAPLVFDSPERRKLRAHIRAVNIGTSASG
jgi:hypothetical protein